MDTSFIIVNYQSEKILKRCIASVRKHAPEIANEIIIVNNDESPLTDFSAGDRIKIIENGKNVGFGKACNIGAKIANGEKLFFLNPDTEIQSRDSEEIFKALDDPAVGIAAPALITSLGDIEQWSCGNEITLASIIKNNLSRNKKPTEQNLKSYIDWVSGGAFAISKKLFVSCGGFDENFFMYFEDVDLCKRIRMLGKKIIVLPHIKVLHLNGRSVTDKKLQKQQYYQSQDYYFKKHFGCLSYILVKTLRQLDCWLSARLICKK